MKELFLLPCFFESKTNQRHSLNVFGFLSLDPKFDTSLIPVYIEYTLAIHWVSPYSPRNNSLTN